MKTIIAGIVIGVIAGATGDVARKAMSKVGVQA